MKKRIVSFFAVIPFLLAAAQPVFYMPLDGSADVIGPEGKKISAGIVSGRADYVSGVSGKALDVTRQAYDQVTTAGFTNLPETDCNAGTVSFRFKPHREENDGKTHWLFSCDTWHGFRYYLLKLKNGETELSVCAPGQIQILKKNLFESGGWMHFAFTWNTKKGEVRLYVNGREVGKKIDPARFKEFKQPQASRIWLGQSGSDRFQTKVGNGLYDEIRIFDCVLSPEEVFTLASGKNDEKLQKLELNEVIHSPRKTEFVFRFHEKKIPSPKALLTLIGEDSKHTITLIAQGASGKLSALVQEGETKKILESDYVLDLTQPHLIAFTENGKTLQLFFDNASQGEIELPKPFGEVASIQGAKGLQLLPAKSVPSEEQIERLTASPVLPVEQPLWNLSDAQRTPNRVRRGVCLNGYWRVIPTNTYSYAPPAGKWGYMRVPGSFRSPLYKIYRDENGKLVPAQWTWNGKPLIDYRAGWYQREFKLPGDFGKDGRIYLDFANLNGNYGRVYLNGKLIDAFHQDFKCFTVIPDSRRIDVTDLVLKDGDNLLTLFIDRSFSWLWMGQPGIGDHEEIAIGDVWLQNAPSKVSLSTALALPSFRKNEVFLRARLANPTGVKGPAEVNFSFRFGKDSPVAFTKKFLLDGSAEQPVSFTETWRNPVLWDVEHPNCYRMTVSLAVDGKTADALSPVDFGFREAWVEKGEFRMNGNKMRMRMWSSPGLNRLRYYYGNPRAVGQYVAHIKALNYDTVRFDPIGGKISQVAWSGYLNECDRQGLYNLFPMPPYEDEEIGGYTKQVIRFLEHYGSHPSILMWYTDFNTCGYSWDQDPAKLNDTKYIPVSKLQARRRAQTAEKLMRAFDPTRELFQHAGGNSGKIFTSMNYQSFGVPLQEQEDWPKQWSEHHTQPLMVVEHSFPYPRQFCYFDDSKSGSLGAEHAARYFGDAAYAKEKAPIPHFSFWRFSPYSNPPTNMIDLSAMLYGNVAKAWRAYGMSALGDFPGGRDIHQAFRTYSRHNVVYSVDNDVKSAGLKPDNPVGWSETQCHLLTDYSRPDYLYKAIRDAFEPLLVFLAGTPEDFTNKDHAFYSGEKFRKSAVIVNDHTTPQTVSFRWALIVDGKAVQQGEMSAAVEPGGIRKLPIELSAPAVLERTDAELRLTAVRNGALLKTDSMKLQFFPKRIAPDFHDVSAGLYDPEGKTEAMLKHAGFPFRKVSTLADVKSRRLLIIGQNALKKNGINPELLKQVEDAGLIENGLKLLIFEQQPCNLGNLVFESPSYRDAFIRRPGSLYVAGLKPEDFHNWRGSSDTIPAFVISAENSPHYPRSKWKCGNGGIVSGNVIRKPSYGNFKSIVDCGFNLMYASLLELRKGHGLVLFCQLDVTSRYGSDPTATRLVDNMLSVMGNRFVPVGPQRVGYLGDEKGEAILKRMGMIYRKLSPNNLWALNGEQVVILGADPVPAGKRDALKKFLAATTVIALPGAPLDLLPGNLKRGEKTLFRASAPKDDPLFAGIPNADLYFRRAHTLPVLTEKPDWMVSTTPALFGRLDRIDNAVVVLNLAPEAIDGLWNREKVSRVWSAIFDNMNLGLGGDLKLFTSRKFRDNTRGARFGEVVPENCELRFDPENNGTPSDTKGFVPIKLGLPWESQGHRQKNPHYQYPANISKQLVRPYDGYAWYWCKVRIPESWKGHKLTLRGGPVDDCDWTYWNGVKIGETTFEDNPKPYCTERNYPIPEKLVRFGAANMLVIRVFDRWGEGGVVGPLSVTTEDAGTGDSWSPYIDKLNFYDGDAFHNW